MFAKGFVCTVSTRVELEKRSMLMLKSREQIQEIRRKVKEKSKSKEIES